MTVYGYLIITAMFALLIIGMVQQRRDLMFAGILLGIAGAFTVLLMGRIEFGTWTWWQKDPY